MAHRTLVSIRAFLAFFNKGAYFARIEIAWSFSVLCVVIVRAVFVIVRSVLRTRLELEEVEIQVHVDQLWVPSLYQRREAVADVRHICA